MTTMLIKTRLSQCLFAACLLLLTTAVNAQTVSSRNVLSDTDLGYTLAVQAAIYGYAPVGMMERFSSEVIEPSTRLAPLDEYFHRSTLSTPESAPFRAPNNDTLYSTAWLDLRTEPVILQMPDTHGRYYVAQVLDLYSDTIANVTSTKSGTAPGSFAVVGPTWKGTLPEGVKATFHSDTVYALVLLRVLVDGAADVNDAAAVQKQFGIAALSRFLKKESGAPAGSMEGLRPYKAENASQRFALLNQFLHMNPIRPGEQALLTQFATINLGPEKVAQRVVTDEALLSRASKDATQIIADAGARSGKVVNGWRMFTEAIGTYGFDYLQRASVWMGGPLANVPEESLYPTAIADASGQPLNAATHNYVVRFTKEQIPPVEGFWSLTMYDRDSGMLVKNPIDRYSIGNRTKGLQFGPDGSLTLYIQRQSPGPGKESNWLPAPDGPFYMSLRLYGPRAEVLDGKWMPPPVEARP